jgi:hypothetical protein
VNAHASGTKIIGGPHSPIHGVQFIVILLVLAGLVYGGIRLRRSWRAAHPRGHAATAAHAAAHPGPAGQPQPVATPAPATVETAEPPPGGWAVETNALTKQFGVNVAVDHVELRVPRKSAFGYLGPNGAGKPVTGL